MFRSKRFSTKELVPPAEYNRWGENAQFLMNALLILTIHTLRSRHGRFIVNSTSRDRQQSGLRTLDYYIREYPEWSLEKCQAEYANYRCEHVRGDAADLIPLDTDLETIYADIRENPDLYPFLSFVEVDITWLHVDVRNQPHITFWSLKTGQNVEVIEQKPVEWNKLVPALTEEDMNYLDSFY